MIQAKICRIPCKWFGFNLLKHQIFGKLLDGSCFVLKEPKPSERGRRQPHFTVYHGTIIQGVGDYRWTTMPVHYDSDLGKALFAAIKQRGNYKVIHKTVKQQVHDIYNPRIVTEAFTPMPHMRIPGGAEPYCYTRKPQKPKTI